MKNEIKIESGLARSFKIPTDAPEADGTFAWSSTTIIVVTLEAGGMSGLGYSYTDTSAAALANTLIKDVVTGMHAFDTPGIYACLFARLRNLGPEGIGATALSAIDMAAWDLKAKLLDLSLTELLGRIRTAVPVYGSGGFTSYDDGQLTAQLGGWAEEGIPRVKMKIGTHPEDDLRRVRVARNAIGPDTDLFVDANGAYSRKQALHFAEEFVSQGVCWFEEPVSSDDLAGLHLLRNRMPAQIEVAAGEYGWRPLCFERMLDAQAVDVLQADATRCGVTGFMHTAALAAAHNMPYSAHCAPSIHVHLGCAAPTLRHLEYFHDHVRIEQMLFDGFCKPVQGRMHPDLSRPGLGLTFKEQDAERYRV